MANRRMFAKSVISSARFLRMPATARLLYYDLGMNADDDGVVEAFAVLRMTGASEDDLKILAAKGFIKVLDEEDLVFYLTDWTKNNQIRRDRYTKSAYADLIPLPPAPPSDTPTPPSGEPPAIPTGNHVATGGEPSDNPTATSGEPHGNQTATARQPAVNPGKVSIGKDRVGKLSTGNNLLLSNPEEKGGTGGETQNTADLAAAVEKIVENYPQELLTLPIRGDSEHRFPIFDFDVEDFKAKYPLIDVLSVLESVRDHLDANPQYQKSGKEEILAYVERQLERANSRAGDETAASENARASPRSPAEVIQELKGGTA